MNKLDKFLSKLSKQERCVIEKIVFDVRNNETTAYHVRKLKGHENVYRIRKGSIRIVFESTNYGNVVVSIGYKNDTTYNM